MSSLNIDYAHFPLPGPIADTDTMEKRKAEIQNDGGEFIDVDFNDVDTTFIDRIFDKWCQIIVVNRTCKAAPEQKY